MIVDLNDELYADATFYHALKERKLVLPVSEVSGMEGEVSVKGRMTLSVQFANGLIVEFYAQGGVGEMEDGVKMMEELERFAGDVRREVEEKFGI